MAKRKEVSDVVREEELRKLDLLPKCEGQKRADDLLRAMLNSPPDPCSRRRNQRRRGAHNR